MEYSKVENLSIQEAAVEAADAQVRDLGELQLALVGGGIGDPVAL